MMKLISLISFWVLVSNISIGQINGSEQDQMQLNKSEYLIGDTVFVTYEFDSLEVLSSNFGGCGLGEYYMVTCHSDSLLTIFQDAICDELITEYYYAKHGHFSFVTYGPGIYSVSLYVKSENQSIITPNERFSKSISSSKFQVK